MLNNALKTDRNIRLGLYGIVCNLPILHLTSERDWRQQQTKKKYQGDETTHADATKRRYKYIIPLCWGNRAPVVPVLLREVLVHLVVILITLEILSLNQLFNALLHHLQIDNQIEMSKLQ